MSELQKRLEPNLSLLQSEEKFISKYSCSIKPTNNTQMSLTMSRISVKIKKLDNVLRKLRTKNRRALIICRSMDMFSIVREHLKRSHFSSIFLDPVKKFFSLNKHLDCLAKIHCNCRKLSEIFILSIYKAYYQSTHLYNPNEFQ